MGSYRNLGPLGLIVLGFGLVAGVVSGDWASLYVLGHVIVGAMMLALFLFTQIDTLRESVGGRRGKYGTNAVVYTVLTIAVIVIINYLAVQHPVRWDLTEQGVFSLAPQSSQVLENLEEPVLARAFYREGEEGPVRDLLESFAAASDRFTYEFLDPDKHPELAQKYEVSQFSTVHLSVGTESTKLTDVSEESITNTLIRMTSAGRKVVYFATGHGEPDPEDSTGDPGYGQAKEALDNEGYDLVSLVLGSVPDVPADADLLILAGPQRPILEREIEVLDRYLLRGGKALLMIDPQQGDQLLPLLEQRGIALTNDVVIEQFVQLFAGATLGLEPIVGNYGTHPITDGFAQRTIYQLARSVRAKEDLPEGITVDELVLTSSSSWAESDLERLFDSGEVQLDDVDTPGPVPLAVAATINESALSWTPPLIQTFRDQQDDVDSTGFPGDPPDDVDSTDDPDDPPDDVDSTDNPDNPPDDVDSTDDPDNPPDDVDSTDDPDNPPEASDNPSEQGEEATSEGPPDDLEGRLVVFGDSVWLSNRYINNYYNRDLFLNAVGWLAGKEELISIRPRATRASQVMLTAGESTAVFYITVLLLPELILFCGMFVWLRRRNR